MTFSVTTDTTFATVNSGTISLGFTTATALAVGNRIVITVPYMYFSAADSTKAATFTMLGAAVMTTATCVFGAGSAAAGSTLTCTTQAAALPGGQYVMTFGAGAVTTGSSQPAGMFNVMTATWGGVTIDAAAPAGGGAPAIS
jgi:hypothetical protein